MSIQTFFKNLMSPRSRKSLANRGRRLRRNMSLAVEVLEDRTMLSIAQDLLGQLAPYDLALNTLLDAATSLPLVGRQLAGLQEFNTLLQDSLASIEAQTQNITNSGHYEIAIPLPSLTKTFTFDLGLDAFL